MDLDPFSIANDIIFHDEYDSFGRGRMTRRPRVVRERVPHFETLDEVDFTKRFRLSKASAANVLTLINHKLEFSTDKNDAVQPMNQFLLTLRYYATGCTQLAAADFSGVAEPTACRIVHRVSDALAELYPEYVYMPRNEAEIHQAQQQFRQIANFPLTIGAVDCPHVRIRSPGGENAEYYRNRKGYFSVNVQAVCNAELQFQDVVARWPGSTHDMTIFDHSRVRAEFESGRYANAVLVGDSAYASRAYMMTPLDRPSTPAEALYNESQIRTRNPIERIFGVLKRRFPALAVGINVQLDKVQAIIIATIVLFNMLRRAGDPQPPDDPSLILPQTWSDLLSNDIVISHPHGQRAPHRNLLINNYFARLM